jgi:hydrogenase expression/formation protein HypE
VVSSGAQAGDALLLAGAVAVEGTGILCAEYAQTLRARGVAEDQIRTGAALLERPGISVLPAARESLSATLPHAMHDPTEGGRLSALREMVAASSAGVRLEADKIPIIPACRTVCDALELEPLGLLASGSLLAAVSARGVEAAREALANAGIEAAVIGTILQSSEGMSMVRGGAEMPLLELDRDELARWAEEQSVDK